MLEQPNNDPALIFQHPGSIEALVGTRLNKKKSRGSNAHYAA